MKEKYNKLLTGIWISEHGEIGMLHQILDLNVQRNPKVNGISSKVKGYYAIQKFQHLTPISTGTLHIINIVHHLGKSKFKIRTNIDPG